MLNPCELVSKTVNLFEESRREDAFFGLDSDQQKVVVGFKFLAVGVVKIELLIMLRKELLKVVTQSKLWDKITKNCGD